MKKKYAVTLTDPEREQLKQLISHGRGAARRLTHARILLKAGEGWKDEVISAAAGVSRATIERVRKRFVEEGLEVALDPRRSQHVRPRKMDGHQEARLVAVVCGPPPEGRARWTLRLLADELAALEVVDAVSHETVRRTLKKTASNRGGSSSG